MERSDHDRIVVMEEKVSRVEADVTEIKLDVKTLLARHHFLGGIGASTTKFLAVLGVMLSAIGLGMRLLHI